MDWKLKSRVKAVFGTSIAIMAKMNDSLEARFLFEDGSLMMHSIFWLLSLP